MGNLDLYGIIEFLECEPILVDELSDVEAQFLEDF